MNLSLLAKMGWHMLVNSDKLWVRILKSKYYRSQTFLETQKSSQASWLWQGILKTKDILTQGSCFVVGDGINIDLWKDPWGTGELGLIWCRICFTLLVVGMRKNYSVFFNRMLSIAF